MTVIAFPRAATLPSRRRIRYPTVREQLTGLQRDLAAAAAQTTDPFAENEFVVTVKRLSNIIKRLEARL